MIRMFIVTLLLALVIINPAKAQLKEITDSLHNSLSKYSHKSELKSKIIPLKAASTEVLDSLTVQEWENGQWEYKQTFKHFYSNDLEDQVVVLKKYQSGEWVDVLRTSTKYNDWSEVIWEQIEIYRNNQWEYVQQKQVTFNSDSYVELYQEWDSVWVNKTRYTGTYQPGTGFLKEILVEAWKGAWENNFRYVMTNDVENGTVKTVEQLWDSNWKNQWQSITITSKDHSTGLSTYYNWVNDDWQPINQTLSTYNSDKIIEMVNLRWQEGWGWVNFDRYSYIYHSGNGLRAEELYQQWNNIDSIWVNDIKNEYEYDDLSGEVETITMLTWEDSIWVNSYRNIFDGYLQMTRTQTSQFWQDEAWINDRLETSVYNLVVSVDDKPALPTYALEQNYPNPFNPVTNLKFHIANTGLVQLKIYDLLGKEVAVLVNEEKPAGEYTETINASNLASGVYYYQLKVNEFISTKKMMVLK